MLNVWLIGKTKNEKPLLSHKTPVQAVSFDPSDEYVASGTSDGTVTLWDLPNEKVGRTFSGHHSAVKSVQFHPSKGYYIVSGAADSTIKIWDARRKNCPCTFKGTSSKPATYTTFSPDGRWIAAGFGNGELEIWDLRSSKQVARYSQHRDRINSIEFHPNECIMASCSQDGTVRLWDLENSETIEKIGSQKTPARCICFSKDGDYIYTAVPDGLLCHSWEPTVLHASVAAGWNHAVDMAVCEHYNKLVICTSTMNTLGSWVVDLKQLKLNFQKDSSRRSSTDSIPSLKIDTCSSNETRDCENSDRPNSGQLSSTSARFSEKYAPFANYSDRSGKVKLYSKDSDSLRTVRNQGSNPGSVRTPTSGKSGKSPHKLNLSSVSLPHHEPSNQLPPKATVYDRGMISCRTHGEGQHQKALLEKYNLKTERYGSRKDNSYSSKDIQIDSFFPKSHHCPEFNVPDFEPTDEDCIRDMISKKEKIRHILSSRACSLQIVRRFWEQEDILGTLKALKKSENPSVSVDFFEAGLPMQKILTLDLIPCLVPLLVDMLQSNHEKYWSVALRILLKLLKTYGGTIRETINGSNMSIGVNLSFEQRHEKCKMAQECLLEILPIVDNISQESGEIGILAKEIHGSISGLTT